MEEEQIQFNFICPFCNKECKENDDVNIDIDKRQFVHQACLIKHFELSKDPDMVVDNGSIDPNSLQG